MSDHPGWLLKVFCNGARTMESVAQKLRVDSWTTLSFPHKFGCAISATIDAIHLLRGYQYARKALPSAQSIAPRCDRFETASQLLDAVRGKPESVQCRLAQLSKEEEVLVWSKHTMHGLNWVISQRDSVFVVILESERTVHTLTVDTRSIQKAHSRFSGTVCTEID